MAVNCCVVPRAMLGLAGVTCTAVRVAEVPLLDEDELPELLEAPEELLDELEPPLLEELWWPPPSPPPQPLSASDMKDSIKAEPSPRTEFRFMIFP